MSIRDIIEKWHRVATNYAQHGYTAAVHARDFEEMRDDFASALEELSLMEAVCEAETGQQVYAALHRLQAYRKERGL